MRRDNRPAKERLALSLWRSGRVRVVKDRTVGHVITLACDDAWSRGARRLDWRTASALARSFRFPDKLRDGSASFAVTEEDDGIRTQADRPIGPLAIILYILSLICQDQKWATGEKWSVVGD